MKCRNCPHFAPEMFSSGSCYHDKVYINAYEPVVLPNGQPVWCPLLEKPEPYTKETAWKFIE